MAKILVFNNDTDRMETYYRGENEAMPYITNNTLRVREFRGSSRSNILWTTKRTMQSWNSQRYIFGSPIPVGFAFKRPYEGGHGNLSQHYAGVAFDVGQTLPNNRRLQLWNSANNSGVWAYVEPISLTPTWVHFDRRFGKPACSTGGYPILKRGSVSNYVCIAQDDLNTLGFATRGLDRSFWYSNTKCCYCISAFKGIDCRWNRRM
ncbi:MAG: peptidoglycan-binding protein [Clostridia bacterium]|nr:peptidoglycan-binding protein [Clostridia bacterium]